MNSLHLFFSFSDASNAAKHLTNQLSPLSWDWDWNTSRWIESFCFFFSFFVYFLSTVIRRREQTIKIIRMKCNHVWVFWFIEICSVYFLFGIAAAAAAAVVATKEKIIIISTKFVFLFTHLRRACVVPHSCSEERKTKLISCAIAMHWLRIFDSIWTICASVSWVCFSHWCERKIWLESSTWITSRINEPLEMPKSSVRYYRAVIDSGTIVTESIASETRKILKENCLIAATRNIPQFFESFKIWINNWKQQYSC